MTDHDLDWLAAQAPRRTAIDHGARERALLALSEHASVARERGFRLGSLLRTRTFGFAVATGAAAIATALVVSSTGGGDGGASVAQVSQGAGAPQAAVLPAATESSPLVRLAAFVSASPKPVGDATLVVRKTGSITVYDLYGDNGQYFFSRAKSGLPGQVAAKRDRADGLFAREVAAAKLAAKGDVEKAAEDMANAPSPSHVITRTSEKADPRARAAKEAATGIPIEGNPSLFANWVWENSQDALIAGAGDPQVRAGVLRILATLPDVTVTHGTSGGHETLVLTAGSDELGGGYIERLTIDADSGVPLNFLGGSAGGETATVHYKVSRVDLAHPLAGTPSATASSQ